MKAMLMTVSVFLAFGFSLSPVNSGDKVWVAPPEANKILNPLKGNVTSIAEGKKLFTQICAVCHGDKGKGDGIGGVGLPVKPGNFTLEKTQGQTDGALFWKLAEGRPPMASYKSVLTVTQRWYLINYIRTFKKK